MNKLIEPKDLPPYAKHLNDTLFNYTLPKTAEEWLDHLSFMAAAIDLNHKWFNKKELEDEFFPYFFAEETTT